MGVRRHNTNIIEREKSNIHFRHSRGLRGHVGSERPSRQLCNRHSHGYGARHHRPIANAGLNQTVRENTLVTFDATASSDNVEIASYTWAFSDVGIPQTLDGEKPTHTFETPGTYNVILNVTDTAGNWATNTITITVLDITKPLANAGQDQTVNVGAKVSFDGSSSTDNVDITRYEWNFGDETTGAGKTTTYTYASPGTYIVTLTVEDAAGNTATHQVTITVLSTEAFPMWMVGAAVVTIAIIAVATVLWRRRNKTPRN